MRIFNAFFKICLKNKGTFILYTIIFLSLTLIFVNQDNDYSIDKFESSSVKIAIFDHDNSNLSKSLTKYITSVHNQIEIDEDIDSIRDAIYTRSVEYVIIINEGFENNILNFNSIDNNDFITSYELPSSISSQFVELTINNFITTFNSYTIAGLDSSKAYEKTLETLSSNLKINFNNKEATESYPKIHFFYIYMSYILMAIIIESISPILLSFNNTEIKKRMALSNMSRTKTNIILALSASVMAILLLVFYVILGTILFGNEMFTFEGILRIINALVYSIICLALSFLFANISTKKNFISMMTNIIALSSSFLCGIFVPREYLSGTVSNIGRFLPAYWYVNVENALLDFNTGKITTILTGYGVQILFFIAIFTVGLIFAKQRGDK